MPASSQPGAPEGSVSTAPNFPPQFHPHALSGANLLFLALRSVFGAVIGLQLLVTLGITPNPSIIGALVAMILARIPLPILAGYRSLPFQKLAPNATFFATFRA